MQGTNRGRLWYEQRVTKVHEEFEKVGNLDSTRRGGFGVVRTEVWNQPWHRIHAWHAGKDG